MDNAVLSIVDRAGNESSINITIEHVHNFEPYFNSEWEYTNKSNRLSFIKNGTIYHNFSYESESSMSFIDNKWEVTVPEEIEYSFNYKYVKQTSLGNVNIKLNDVTIKSLKENMLEEDTLTITLLPGKNILTITFYYGDAHLTPEYNYMFINLKNISVHKCSLCGCIEPCNLVDEIVKESTCIENGVKESTCIDCGYTNTENLPTKDSHNFANNICTICGKEEYINIEIDRTNYYMTGLSDSGNIVIPKTFTYHGQGYKIIAIGDINKLGSESKITSITLPNTIKEIKNEAFRQYTNLHTVIIEDGSGELSIGDYAFCNCSILKNVHLQNKLSYIGKYAFSECEKLENINLQGNFSEISSSAFYYCRSLSEITIPNSVTSIGSYAFGECRNLNSVTIPNSVTSIGSDAFYNVPHIYYDGTASGSPWGAKAIN